MQAKGEENPPFGFAAHFIDLLLPIFLCQESARQRRQPAPSSAPFRLFKAKNAAVISLLVAILLPLNMVMPPEGVTGGFIAEMIAAFLLANIPTIILLLIFFGFRGKSGARSNRKR